MSVPESKGIEGVHILRPVPDLAEGQKNRGSLLFGALVASEKGGLLKVFFLRIRVLF